MTRTEVSVRPMQAPDLSAVLQIQRACFDDARQESRESFLAKLAASPSTCFVAVQDDAVTGYLVAIPADSRNPPELDARSHDTAGTQDCLYLHDLSVFPRSRGSGAADALVAAFLSSLRQLGLKRACLTAVNDSSKYWARHGFKMAAGSDPAAGRIATYGEGARYMVLEVN